MTGVSLREIRTLLDAALQTVTDQCGVSFKIGKISYSSTNFRTELQAFCATPDGNTVDPNKAEFDRWCTDYGLQPDDFGKTFQHGGRPFIVCGLNRKAVKMPILGRAAGSTAVYKFQSGSVARQLHPLFASVPVQPAPVI